MASSGLPRQGLPPAPAASRRPPVVLNIELPPGVDLEDVVAVDLVQLVDVDGGGSAVVRFVA